MTTCGAPQIRRELAGRPSGRVAISRQSERLCRQFADELSLSAEVITRRWLCRVRREARPGDGPFLADLEARLEELRQDVAGAVRRLTPGGAEDRRLRIAQVRTVLVMSLNAAADLLLAMVDGPDRPHYSRSDPTPADRRKDAVYAHQIRSALRPHSLGQAVLTIRSRGYQLSGVDAKRIRSLWGEAP